MSDPGDPRSLGEPGHPRSLSERSETKRHDTAVELNRRDPTVPDPAPPFDPLRLCVYTTVALIACLLGPIALLGFALLAIAGYARARRAGLLRSRCKLGDTRVVLLYLSVVAVAAAVATPFWVAFWLQTLTSTWG